MVNLCKAGEVGGFLDAVLLQIAENYEAEVKLRGKIKSAMTYPIVVGCIAIIALIVMLTFIVPSFAKIFSQLGAQAAGADPDPRRPLARDEVHAAARASSAAIAFVDRVEADQAPRRTSGASSTR